MNRFSLQLNPEHVRLETFAFAFRAAHIKVAQELHLDLLVAGARATFATAVAGVKGKRAGGQSLRQGCWLRGKQFAQSIEQTEIENRRRSRCARQRRLVNHYHLPDAMRSGDRFARARLLI